VEETWPRRAAVQLELKRRERTRGDTRHFTSLRVPRAGEVLGFTSPTLTSRSHAPWACAVPMESTFQY